MKVLSPLTTISSSILVLAASSSSAASIHRDVHRRLEQRGSVDIVVEMRASSRHRVLETAERMAFDSHAAKIEFVVDTLQAIAAQSQREIDALLAHGSSVVDSLFVSQYTSWSRNARYFSGTSLRLVESLAALPSVGAIRLPQHLYAIGIFDLMRRLRNSMIPINDPNTLLTPVNVVAFTHVSPCPQ